MASAWQWYPGLAPRWRQYGDEVLVFNNLSGDTHLLSADAMLVLDALRHGARARAALIAALGVEDAADAAALDALLAQLVSHHLLAQAPC